MFFNLRDLEFSNMGKEITGANELIRPWCVDNIYSFSFSHQEELPMSFAENNPVVVSATAMQDKPDGVTKSPRSGMYADDSDEEEDETESEWEKEKREKHVSDFKLGCVY